MPPYEHSSQLAAEAAALQLPPRLHAAVTAALPLTQQQGLAAVPTCRAAAAGSGSSLNASSSMLTLDPWLLLEGGTAGGLEAPVPAAFAPGMPTASRPAAGIPAAAAAAAGSAPPWLEGAVKRRRRDLCYMPAPASHAAGAPPSIEEQLMSRGNHTLPGEGALGKQPPAVPAQ